MIALCVNLARRIGLRAAADALKMFLDWLGISAKLPTWTTIRTWLLRTGVAEIGRPIEPADDWIWMADHSNQIGQEKALSIIGLRASQLPPPGEPLKHEHVRVLELAPGTSWKREDVAEVYDQLAQQCGAPLAVLVDGAVELREGAEVLEKHGKNTLVLDDFKHYAANVQDVAPSSGFGFIHRFIDSDKGHGRPPSFTRRRRVECRITRRIRLSYTGRNDRRDDGDGWILTLLPFG